MWRTVFSFQFHSCVPLTRARARASSSRSSTTSPSRSTCRRSWLGPKRWRASHAGRSIAHELNNPLAGTWDCRDHASEMDEQSPHHEYVRIFSHTQRLPAMSSRSFSIYSRKEEVKQTQQVRLSLCWFSLRLALRGVDSQNILSSAIIMHFPPLRPMRESFSSSSSTSSSMPSKR